MINKLPFENKSKISVILPTNLSMLAETEKQQVLGTQKLFEEHRVALERELGAPFEFSQEIPNNGSRWLIGPFKCNPAIAYFKSDPGGPEIFLDRSQYILVTDGRNPSEVIETYSYLRSLHQFPGGTWKIKDCKTVNKAIERIVNEVKYSYPAFDLRKLDWEKICQKHIPLVQAAVDPIPAIQEWLAELQDGHTWIRPVPPLGELPYDIWTDGNTAKFYRVPEHSKGFALGLRSGFKLLNEDLRGWWKRTAATPHSKPFLVGRRIFSAKLGKHRKVIAKSSQGKIIEWIEEVTANRWEPVITWKKLPSGNGYIKIQAWLLGKNLEQNIDQAFDCFRACPKLIVDLRGNPGGNLILAHQFRNRFLKEEKIIGWFQNTLPDGRLSDKEPIIGKPASSEKRWRKPVVFLTDPLTYSASEDALLGVQGQENVTVVGQASGGGSGRMRLIRLLPGWKLTISTSLTFDLFGNCIEGSGIPVDTVVPLNSCFDGLDPVLEFAAT